MSYLWGMFDNQNAKTKLQIHQLKVYLESNDNRLFMFIINFTFWGTNSNSKKMRKIKSQGLFCKYSFKSRDIIIIMYSYGLFCGEKVALFAYTP